MKIKTKYNIGDIVYFKENDIVFKGKITGIEIHTHRSCKNPNIVCTFIGYIILYDSACGLIRFTNITESMLYPSFKAIERTINYALK